MADPAIEEKSESLKETMEEISRQMEDLVPEKEKTAENEDIADDISLDDSEDLEEDEELWELEEIPLNIDDEEEDEINLEEELEENKLEKESDHSSQVEENKEAANTESKDEIGIEVEDDELWEDEEVEEIPLFEEELLNEIKKDEEKEEEKSKKDDKAHITSEESKSVEVESSIESENKDDNKGVKKDIESVEEAEKSEVVDDNNRQELLQKVFSLLPWIITFFSTIFCIIAILTIINLWQSASSDNTYEESPKQSVNEGLAAPINKQPTNHPLKKQTVTRQSVDLAPFIIPGRSGGELVFFKLQVELIVPDAITKQALLRRQAWVRDIIYQELKGLDISSGIRGDVLQKYRRPLIVKLNKALSPIKIEDIRLMGYILR